MSHQYFLKTRRAQIMLKATLSRWLSSKFKKSFILPFIRYHSHFRPLRGTEDLHPDPLTNIWAAEENIFVSTNLDRDFFRYLWYCGKKPNRMWLSVLCTLIDNEYASSQWSKFVVYSLGCNLVPRRSLRCLPLSFKQREAVKKEPGNEVDSAVMALMRTRCR